MTLSESALLKELCKFGVQYTTGGMCWAPRITSTQMLLPGSRVDLCEKGHGRKGTGGHSDDNLLLDLVFLLMYFFFFYQLRTGYVPVVVLHVHFM